MASVNTLNAALIATKQAIEEYKKTNLYQIHQEFKDAVDRLEKQLLDQENYAKTIKESILFDSYFKTPEYRLTEANIALAKGDFFKANWILSSLQESNETNLLRGRIYEQTYFNSIGQLFETCSNEEAAYYGSHLSEKALFGSMASQIKKLTLQIKDVQDSLATLDEVQSYNKEVADRKNAKFEDKLNNARIDAAPNMAYELEQPETVEELRARARAAQTRDKLQAKQDRNNAGSQVNQKISAGKDEIAALKNALNDLSNYLNSEKLKNAITLVDRNTTLFGGAKVDGFLTSKTVDLAGQIKQVAASMGVSQEEIKAEDNEIAQEEQAINNDKATAAPQQNTDTAKYHILQAAQKFGNGNFTANDIAQEIAKTYNKPTPMSTVTRSLYSAGYVVDPTTKKYVFKGQPQQTQQVKPQVKPNKTSYIEGFNESVDYSLLFESILYEGLWDKVKTGASALATKAKTGITNAANNAKEYFANNTVDDLKQADIEDIRNTFTELAKKVAAFNTSVKAVQPIFNATGNSKFEKFNRKLGKALLTAGGIVRLAGVICPPIAAVGSVMAGIGAVANALGNTRKDIVTGHKGKAAVDIVGGIAGAAMGASKVGQILGKSGNILAKVSGAGQTLTGVKTTINGVDKIKNSQSTMGKGMGVLSALGGIAMTMAGLSALGVQFGGAENLPAEDAARLQKGDQDLQKGAESIVNDEQVRELTAERDYLEQNPTATTEHSDLLNDTITRQVGNSNEAIANAKVGDWIIRDDGTKIELKQFDIDYAKAAIGEIKPEENPFNPENPMVGQITSKGHMITDKDMALLKPQGQSEVVQTMVPQVEGKLPEAPAAPISQDALNTDLPPTEGVDELSNTPEAIEAKVEDIQQTEAEVIEVAPNVGNELNDAKSNIQWDNNVNEKVTGEYRTAIASIYGQQKEAITFDTGVTVCPIMDPKTGNIIFTSHFKGETYISADKVVGVPSDKTSLLKAVALRNAGFKVSMNTEDFTNGKLTITDAAGNVFKTGIDLNDNAITAVKAQI
ncbi:MAG: hypothetical protein HUJ68_02745 [Clostridia bacterium]|nr:hypothetical protein [Clostridia bacterium]